MLASSSEGNCYALKSGNSVLLLEAGIPVSRLRKKLPVGLSRVVGCLVTHEHGDHAGYVKQYLDAGIPVHMSKGTRAVLGMGYVLPETGVWKRPCFIGGWNIQTFKTEHDAADPVGFFIASPDKRNRIVFATDTYLLNKIFPGVQVWMLECNYDLQILQENITAGAVDEKQAKRILTSHMSVDHVIAFLQKQDLAKTQAIYLLHGSSRNLNKQAAVDKVRAATGKPVYMEGV